jgi:hypothetical protein
MTQDTGAVLGTVDNPMSREQLVAKCHDLMSPVRDCAVDSPLVKRVLHVETIRDVRDLRPLLQRTYHSGPPQLSQYPRRQ